MRKYKPNYNDSRVLSRIKEVLIFAKTHSITKETPYSTGYLETYFGEPSRQLSQYLKRLVLKTTNHNYSHADGRCREYVINQIGVDYLSYVYDNAIDKKPINYSFRQWQDANERLSDLPPDISIHQSDFDELEQIIADIIDPTKVSVFDKRVILPQLISDWQDYFRSGKIEYNDKSHRLWHDLQMYRKPLKELLFTHVNYLHQYDISAAMPTLVYQLARENGCVDLTHIEYYLNNKTEVRNQLAQELKISPKIVKIIINGLFNGAKISKYSNSSIFLAVNRNYWVIDQLKKNHFIMGLRIDISKIWKQLGMTDMIEPEYVTYTRNDKEVTRKKAINSRKKSYVYFELERMIMDHVRVYLNKSNINHFNEHDGWASQFEINTTELSAYIKEQTGYDVKFDYTLLKPTAETITDYEPKIEQPKKK